jgi:hypothetical protein
MERVTRLPATPGGEKGLGGADRVFDGLVDETGLAASSGELSLVKGIVVRARRLRLPRGDGFLRSGLLRLERIGQLLHVALDLLDPLPELAWIETQRPPSMATPSLTSVPATLPGKSIGTSGTVLNGDVCRRRRKGQLWQQRGR